MMLLFLHHACSPPLPLSLFIIIIIIFTSLHLNSISAAHTSPSSLSVRWRNNPPLFLLQPGRCRTPKGGGRRSSGPVLGADLRQQLWQRLLPHAAAAAACCGATRR